MKRVAVLGSSGQLGSDLVTVLEGEGYEVVSLAHADVECTAPDSVWTAVVGVRPDIVVNCAALVRVDECEDRSQDAFRVNTLGPLFVARACAMLNALCVYISTDYVFDGEKGESYTEEDPPCPINVYGTSKLAGEHLVEQTCPRWLIVRVASLFGKAGSRGKGGNFVETILAKAQSGQPLRVVHDIRMSPTYTHDAARALERLLRHGARGLFHLTNAGSCTWYEFARKALDLSGLDGLLEPISSQDYPYKAPRPRDSSLRSTQLDGFVKECLRPWQEALKAYLVEKGYMGC
jgi:dTDP-4-dehydrorhamnose reductase